MAIYKPKNIGPRTIDCPLCGASIPRGTRKCDHCGNVLQPAAPVAAQQSEPSESLGNAMIAVPVIGTIVTLLWIARVNVLEEPFSKLLIVAGAVVALTAVLGIMEAFLSGAGSDENASGPAAYGPALWIPLLTLGWIAGFPLYLKARAARGLKDLFQAGVGVLALFLLVILGVGWHVKSKEAVAIANALELEKLEKQVAVSPPTPAPTATAPTDSGQTAASEVTPPAGTDSASVAAPEPAPMGIAADAPVTTPEIGVTGAPASEDSFAALAAEVGVEQGIQPAPLVTPATGSTDANVAPKVDADSTEEAPD